MFLQFPVRSSAPSETAAEQGLCVQTCQVVEVGTLRFSPFAHSDSGLPFVYCNLSV
jgi:hypothetical protein